MCTDVLHAAPLPSPQMCEASPTQLQFAEGDGDDEVPLLDCNHGAVWVGSLKIRFNNKKWITEQFGPHCLTRILEHGEGFAILEFPKIQVVVLPACYASPNPAPLEGSICIPFCSCSPLAEAASGTEIANTPGILFQ